MFYFCTFPCIFSAKKKCFLHFSHCCVNKSPCNTVRCLQWITSFNTLITFFYRLFLFFFVENKFISYCPSRHSYRTVHNHNVFLPGIQICLLIPVICITLISCYKSGSHLYTISTSFHCMTNISFIKNTSTYNDWYLFIIFFFIFFYHLNNSTDFTVIIRFFRYIFFVNILIFYITKLT